MKALFLLPGCFFFSVLHAQNVGIGTATPATKLHVSGTGANIATFSGGNGMFITLAEGTSNRGYIGSFTGNAEDVDFGTYSGNATGKIHLTTNNTARLTVSAAGNIGISQQNPTVPLNFPDVTGNKISLWGTGTNHYGMGIQAFLMQFYTSANYEDIAFGYGNSNAFTENMRIKGNGNVGIGTSSPVQKLQINGAIKIADANGSPTEGTIRFNPVNKDFEGYTGTEWKSLTITGNFLPLDMDSISNGLSDESFGYSVRATGNWLFVGTPFDNVGGAADRGSVTVYKKNLINGKYEKYQTLLAPGGVAGDQFGYALDVMNFQSNGHEFIFLFGGAPYSEVGGTLNQGAVFVFYFDPYTQFFEPNSPAYIVSTSPSSGSGFGKSIDAAETELNYQFNRSELLIGAPDKTIGGNLFQGEVTYFEFSFNTVPLLPGPLMAAPLATISNPVPASNSYFGSSVCLGKIKIKDGSGVYEIDSRSFIVGSPGTTVNGNANQGIVYAFQLHTDGAGTVVVLDTIIVAQNGNAGDNFGSEIYYEEQNLQYFIAAPNKEVGTNAEQGVIYVFRDSVIRFLNSYEKRHGWIQKATVSAPDGAATDKMGKKISYSNGFLFAGAINRDDIAPNAGAVYIFQKQAGFNFYNYTFRKKITDLFGQNGDMLGDSFDINGNQIIIGVPNYDAPGRFNTGKIIFSSIF